MKKHVNDLQAKILHKNEVIEASTLQINEREDELKVKNTELEAIVKETEKRRKSSYEKNLIRLKKVIEERLLNSYSRIRGSVKNGLAVVSVF